MATHGRPRSAAAVSAGWLRALLLHLVAGRRQHVPLGTERLHALAVGVASLAVGRVVVQRVAVVGDLGRAAGPGRGPEQGGGRATAGLRRPGRGVRRPGAGAGAVARGRRALVLLEQVQRAAAAIDEDLAE